MTNEEAVRLSEAEDVHSRSHRTLATVKTDMYLLIFRGSKSGANLVMDKFGAGRFIYWRCNQIDHVLNHRIILADAHQAALARMFAEGQSVEALTVGDLATARNEINIPWLPSNLKHIDDREYDRAIRKIAYDVRTTASSLRWTGHTHLNDGFNALADEVVKLLRRP